tara:strand:+ start:251 stop:703 length:453 start_codon:yes stop_codon:yes gene_type:complete
MAIERGAGTEIIRSAHFEDVDSTQSVLIYGVQHHIYTVLSVIIYCETLATSGNYFELNIHGYDTKAGTTDQKIILMQHDFGSAGETFIWDTKFTFNGHEPVDFTGPIDSIAKQDAIADQGSAVRQEFRGKSESGSDVFEVTVSYVDQNNA